MSSPNWSFTLGAAIRGLSLARETDLLLIRGENHTITLLNARGALQGQLRRDGLIAADLADDGSALAAASEDGRIWSLAPDLTVRWEAHLRTSATAIALDMFGQYLAVSDKKNKLHLFDRANKLLGQFDCPRPLQFLKFIPTLPRLAASAAFGWAGCLDLASGHWAWSDRPVSNVGSLAVAANGEPLLLACFSDGIRRYDAANGLHGAIKLPAPCGQVSLNFAGDRGVAAGAGKELFGFNANGDLSFSRELDESPVALALSALGERLVWASANGRVQSMSLSW